MSIAHMPTRGKKGTKCSDCAHSAACYPGKKSLKTYQMDTKVRILAQVEAIVVTRDVVSMKNLDEPIKRMTKIFHALGK